MMKHKILMLAAFCVLLLGCSTLQNAEQNTNLSDSDTAAASLKGTAASSLDANDLALPDTLLQTYYLSSEDPVYTYLQNHSIQRFFRMWVKNLLDDDMEVKWNYDSLAKVQLLDHNFNDIAKRGTELYTCTFSTDDGRYGYIIVQYGEGEEGPYIQKWSLVETTPYLYDLLANSSQISAVLKETDIDLSSASASRVEWIDTDKNRGDRIILFTDGKEDKYVCYLGEDNFTIEKQQT